MSVSESERWSDTLQICTQRYRAVFSLRETHESSRHSRCNIDVLCCHEHEEKTSPSSITRIVSATVSGLCHKECKRSDDSFSSQKVAAKKMWFDPGILITIGGLLLERAWKQPRTERNRMETHAREAFYTALNMAPEDPRFAIPDTETPLQPPTDAYAGWATSPPMLRTSPRPRVNTNRPWTSTYVFLCIFFLVLSICQ